MEPGEGPDRHIRSLQRLDPPDEQNDRPVRWQADGTTRATPIAGGEEGVLDGRRHRLDHAVRVAVQTAELALLLRTADADRVTATDHVGLGAVAPLRLEVAALGLDPGQGVERRNQRHVEAVLEAMAGDTAQPVVAVDHVDTARGRDVVADAVGEARRPARGAPPWEGRMGRRGCAPPSAPARRPARQADLAGRPACTSCTRRRPGRAPRRPRARTRSSLRCRRSLAGRAGTCEGRSGRPAARQGQTLPIRSTFPARRG